MTLADYVILALRASLFGIVLSLGLRTTVKEAMWALRNPVPLLFGVVTMYVVMPLVAVGLAFAFSLPPAVEIALIALALSPVPPVLPMKELKAGGESAHVFGLFVAAGLLAIVLIPFGVPLISSLFGGGAEVSRGAIARLVGLTVLAPLAAGIVISGIAPALANRIADPLAKVSTVVLLVGILPILARAAPAMGTLIGDGTVAAFAVFVVVGLASGHMVGKYLGGPGTVLSLSNATRHPGVALAIASGLTPPDPLVAPATLVYLITAVVLSGVYLAWLNRAHGGHAAAAP